MRKNINQRFSWPIALALVMVTLFSSVGLSGPRTSLAQANSQTFPETGMTLCDPFLSYWRNNGGLTQQGLPLSNVLAERSTSLRTSTWLHETVRTEPSSAVTPGNRRWIANCAIQSRCRRARSAPPASPRAAAPTAGARRWR